MFLKGKFEVGNRFLELFLRVLCVYCNGLCEMYVFKDLSGCVNEEVGVIGV